ncbi:MAG: hypothetical protein JO197_07410 [Acidobacteria bacterium]|nr:hypothetical protein [Acidobacteriota bacterium]MBV9475782.1 hypothetical protein [Acidobacteriota bacterium]
MILTAAALTLAIQFELDLTALVRRGELQQPVVRCGISTVGYHFNGRPGQQFVYAGERFEIPEEGWIELLADRRHHTYVVDGRELQLDAGALDAFSFRHVTLPPEQ